jgi:uncharacterized OB-fold protein
MGESAKAEGRPGPNRTANLVSLGENCSGGISMAKCVDCGERIATWEDYCPKCGARKPVTGQAKEAPGASKKGVGLFGRLRKTP